MYIDKNTENELLEGLIKSSHYCFRQLFNRYNKPLLNFSKRYLRSDEIAEDVVQEVFIKIWNKRKDIDSSKSFKTYIFTTALNIIRKHFNKLAESNQAKFEIVRSFSDMPDKLAYQDNVEEMFELLEQLINCLPERQKQVFIRRKLDGRSQKEVAEEYQISVKTVDYHVSEAMKFLKKEFAKHGNKSFLLFLLIIGN
ncbi:MAG TPA: RNA polymerase sigma-70 factor [Mariniphaga sp.]|nr:RNA polymerase sigma-70 factor [Mariniphaga sp.]